MHISECHVIEFLSDMFQRGVGYSAICSAKAAIINFVTLTSNTVLTGDAPLISKFMKGVFALRPALPRYGATWDVQLVLNYLQKQSPPEALSLMALTMKFAMLLVILTGHRGQTIFSIERKAIECNDKALVISFTQRLKTTRPGRHCDEAVLPAFAKDPRLCVVKTYRAYIKRTLRYKAKPRKLFIATQKPYGPIKRETFSRWIKTVMAKAGINSERFSPHSTRGAATSKAWAKGLPIGTIMKSAGWESSSTFRKFYERPITREGAFAKTILASASQDS